jgi:hypothetical protein
VTRAFAVLLSVSLAGCVDDGVTWTLMTTVTDDRCSDVQTEDAIVVRDADTVPVVDGYEDVACGPIPDDISAWRLLCENATGDAIEAVVLMEAHTGALRVTYGQPENCSIRYDVAAVID